MRSSFYGFYGNSEETIGKVFTCDETVFIFDTNILLTLYRCEEETRDQFFAIWRKVKDQCWFPHHVCLEYQRNRLGVVKGSRDSLSAIHKKINSTIIDLKKDIYGETYNKTISRYTNLHGELDILFDSIDKLIKAFDNDSIEVRNNKIDFFSTHDVIRDQIDELTEGRIGPAPKNQEVISLINSLGKIRYKYNIGPGFEDAKDKKNDFYSYGNINYDGEYGDYYVWSQMLDYVATSNVKNVVYVTNDAKSDFFFKIDGKVRGPNESLITEMKSKGANEFILQNINTFLHHANTHLNAEIDDTSISELTNASPLTIKNKYFTSALAQKAAKQLVLNVLMQQSSLEIYPNEMETSYFKAKERLEAYLTELAIMNDAPVNDFNSAEMATYENQRNQLLTKIEKAKMTTRLIETMLINKNDDALLGPNDVNDSDLNDE